jgi:hypothetical protein
MTKKKLISILVLPFLILGFGIPLTTIFIRLSASSHSALPASSPSPTPTPKPISWDEQLQGSALDACERTYVGYDHAIAHIEPIGHDDYQVTCGWKKTGDNGGNYILVTDKTLVTVHLAKP